MIWKNLMALVSFEFRRHFDPKGELIAILLLSALAGVRILSDLWIQTETSEPVVIVVADHAVAAGTRGKFTFIEGPATLHGGESLLPIISGHRDYFSIALHQHVSWLPALRQELTAITTEARAAEHGLGAQEWVAIGADAVLEPNYVLPGSRPMSAEIMGVSVAFIVLSALALLGAQGMLFTGLLNERFGKATEMIISAMPAEHWLEVKVAAATLHGIKTILVYGLFSALAAASMGVVDKNLWREMWRNGPQLMWLAVYCVAGLMVWNWLFAWVASLIRSPYSVLRNTLGMLPLTTILLCLGAVRSPDGAALYFASLFPLTSMTGMPVRIMQGYVPVHELCLGLAVLMLALALLRRSARSAYVNASVGS